MLLLWLFVSFNLLSLITPAAALSSCHPLLFFPFVLPAAALLLVPLYYSLSYYPCCCSVVLFHFTILYLITPAAALSFCSPLLFFLLLSLLLLCLLVPLYSFLCAPCCFALFPFTLLSLIIPAAALSSCSHSLFCLFVLPAALPCFPLLFFLLISLLLLCLLVPLYSSLSYYPSAALSTCSPLLFSLSIPCCSALFSLVLLYSFFYWPGRVAQSVTCLVSDAMLTADPGVVRSIPARSHTFVENDHEIISTVILLPSAESFMKGCCQLQAKVYARLLVNCLFKLAQEKSVVRWTDRPAVTIAVDLGR